MTTPDVFRDAEYIADVSDIPIPDDRDGHDVALTGPRADATTTTRDHERRRKVQSAAKTAFIDRLLRDLDIMIYCELSALYYLDCSLISFAIRAIVQLIFFTPKAPPFEPTRNQPFIGAIFGSNLFCMLLHVLLARPEAGEETRGYLHGGLFIDFIGQKGPVSKVRLVMLDMLVMVLHFIMLGLVLERVKTSGSTGAATSTPSDDGAVDQDHDAEERGVLRRDRRARSRRRRAAGDDIELGDLTRHSRNPPASASADESSEWTELLAEPSDGSQGPRSKDRHPLDSFMTGEAVIMDMDLVATIREQWRYDPSSRSRQSSSTYVPSNETATFLRERFGLEVAPDGRVVRVDR
ncbi:hypothetical protein VTN02DRAFT_3310 [Thermoascus thermophilus]